MSDRHHFFVCALLATTKYCGVLDSEILRFGSIPPSVCVNLYVTACVSVSGLNSMLVFFSFNSIVRSV